MLTRSTSYEGMVDRYFSHIYTKIKQSNLMLLGTKYYPLNEPTRLINLDNNVHLF